MSESTVVIRGQEVATTFVVLNVVWDVCVVIMWSILIVLARRLTVKLRHSNRSYAKTMRIRMAHVYGMAVLFTILGVDLNAIYYAVMDYVDFGCVHELEIVSTSFVIFFFFSHLETYFATYQAFTVPTWIAKTRVAWLYVNAIVGHTLLITHQVLRRLGLKFIVHVWVGAQLVLLGPLLFVVVFRISKSIDLFREKNFTTSGAADNTERRALAAKMRRFQRFSQITSFMMVVFGVAFLVVFPRRVVAQWDERYPERLTREGRSTFTASDRNLFRWAAFVFMFYLIWIHWVEPQRNVQGGLPAQDTSLRTRSRRKQSSSQASTRSNTSTHTLRRLSAAPISIKNGGVVKPPPHTGFTNGHSPSDDSRFLTQPLHEIPVALFASRTPTPEHSVQPLSKASSPGNGRSLSAFSGYIVPQTMEEP